VIKGGSALHVMNVSQNLHAENDSSKKVKTDDFFILKPQRISLPELTFSTYPHKLQNLSFDLAMIIFLGQIDFFYAGQREKKSFFLR
jgi:hypothetical protein